MAENTPFVNPFLPSSSSAPSQPPAGPPPLEQAREEAFSLLREIVVRYETTGRKPLLAGVKPEIQRRTEGRFSETALGFATFREFVETAVKGGYVTAAEVGQSLLLHVDGVETQPFSKSRRPEAGPKRRAIRTDLWKAFVDWNPAVRRLWDTQEQTTLMYGESLGIEDPEAQARRTIVESQPERFIEIPRIPFETQVRWMTDYAESLPERPHGRLLLACINGDARPANAFMNYLRDNNELSPDWNMLKTSRVRSVIDAWVHANDLDLDILKLSPTPSDRPIQPVLESAESLAAEPTPGLDAERVRKLIISAVSRMPLADLLRLQIPIEYLVDPG